MIPMRTPLFGSAVSAPAGFDPTTLFSGGLKGFFFDFSDLSTMYQSGTRAVPGTPVAANNDPVGLVLDKSGNNYDLSQATGTKKPLWQTGGGLNWLKFDGVDDYMDAPFSGGAWSQPNDVSMALMIDSFTNTQNIWDGITTREAMLKTNGNGNIQLFANAISAASVSVSLSTATVLTAHINGSSSFARKNKVAGTTVAAGSATLNGWRFGCFAGTSAFFNGKCYGVIARDTQFTAPELANLETWLGSRAGLSI